METTESGMSVESNERVWSDPDRGCRVGAKVGFAAHKRWSLFAFFLHLPPPACMLHGGTLFWPTTTSRRSTSPILYLCLCQSWSFPRKLAIISTFHYILTSPLSSVMIKGNASYYFFLAGERSKLTLPQCNVGDHYRSSLSQILQFARVGGSRYNGRSARNWRI